MRLKTLDRRPRFVVKALATLLALMLAVASTGGLGATRVQADPGTCGVRGGTETAPGGNILYQVRNRCSSTQRFRVYFPEVDRYTDTKCTAVGAGAYNSFASKFATNNWVIRKC